MKPARPAKFQHDDKSLCPSCNTYNVGDHKPYCDFAPEPEPSFEDGAMLAISILKKQLDERVDRTRSVVIDNDTALVLNGVANVLTGVRIGFETELLKQLNERRAKQKK